MSTNSEKTPTPQHARRPPFGAAARRGLAALTLSTPLAARELAPVGVLPLGLGALVYGQYVTHGSYYYEDWAHAALTSFPPHPGYLGVLRSYFSYFGFRPVLAAYIPTLYAILGLHQHLHIAWSVFLAVVGVGRVVCSFTRPVARAPARISDRSPRARVSVLGFVRHVVYRRVRTPGPGVVFRRAATCSARASRQEPADFTAVPPRLCPLLSRCRHHL